MIGSFEKRADVGTHLREGFILKRCAVNLLSSARPRWKKRRREDEDHSLNILRWLGGEAEVIAAGNRKRGDLIGSNALRRAQRMME